MAGDGRVRVTVECPKGSRWRLRLDAAGCAVRIRLLPDALRYPCNYGYVPDTLAGDGDELDAILIGGRRVSAGGRAHAVVAGGLSFRDRRGDDPKLLVLPCRPGDPAPRERDLFAWEERLRAFFSAYKPAAETPRLGPRVDRDEALSWLADARRRAEAP